MVAMLLLCELLGLEEEEGEERSQEELYQIDLLGVL